MAAHRTVDVRIVVVDPVPGCRYALQRKRAGLDQEQLAAGSDLVFTTTVTLKPGADGSLDASGEHVQGPRGARFLYVNSGTLAEQPDSCWTRRAKVPLGGLPDAFSRNAPARRVEGRIHGWARDGGPACASVKLLDGWRSVD